MRKKQIDKPIDKPIDRQQYKLLPPSEREFVGLSQEQLKTRYKNPENAILQYNSRIRYRSINAIKDLVWLTQKLSEEQLRKIYTVEQILQLLTIINKVSNFVSEYPKLDDFVPRKDYDLVTHNYIEEAYLHGICKKFIQNKGLDEEFHQYLHKTLEEDKKKMKAFWDKYPEGIIFK